MEEQQRNEVVQQIMEELGDPNAFSGAGYFQQMGMLEKSATFRNLSVQDKIAIRWNQVMQPALRASFKTTWGRVQWAFWLLFMLPGAVIGIIDLFESEEPRSSRSNSSSTSTVSRSAQPSSRTTQPTRTTQSDEINELDVNERNCAKIGGVFSGDNAAVAQQFGVSISSVRFLGAKWDWGPYATKECMATFDTAAGPKKCQITVIYAVPDSSSAITTIDPYNIGKAPLCR